MPRKVTKKLQRELKPDRRYQSVLVQRLINKSMLDGKKLAAERAVYTALETAAKKLDSEDPLAVFEKALKNVSPSFEVKSRRVGGANYQLALLLGLQSNAAGAYPKSQRSPAGTPSRFWKLLYGWFSCIAGCVPFCIFTCRPLVAGDIPINDPGCSPC